MIRKPAFLYFIPDLSFDLASQFGIIKHQLLHHHVPGPVYLHYNWTSCRFCTMPSSTPISMISPVLLIPSPKMISNSAWRKRGPLFFHHFNPRGYRLIHHLWSATCGGYPAAQRHKTSGHYHRWWFQDCRTLRQSSHAAGWWKCKRCLFWNGGGKFTQCLAH